jgi:hypothetical protein
VIELRIGTIKLPEQSHSQSSVEVGEVRDGCDQSAAWLHHTPNLLKGLGWIRKRYMFEPVQQEHQVERGVPVRHVHYGAVPHMIAFVVQDEPNYVVPSGTTRLVRYVYSRTSNDKA